MPEVIETTVYRLNELSDAAKDKARAWYREGGFDYDWYDAVYEDFQRIAEILGLNLKTRSAGAHGARRIMDGRSPAASRWPMRWRARSTRSRCGWR